MAWEVLEGDELCVLRTLATDSVDSVVTDPPYASGGSSTVERRRSGNAKYQKSGTESRYPLFMEGELRDQRSWMSWMSEILSECYRITRSGGVLVLFSDWRQLPAVTDALQWAGWCWRCILPWDKTEASRTQRGRFSQQCEFIVWGSKGDLPLERATLLPGSRLHRVDPRVKKHVAGEPVPLMHDVLTICAPGSTVIDPFCGSGSTGVAALRHGLAFVGIEASPEYAEIARTELRDAESAYAPIRALDAGAQLALDTRGDEHEQRRCPRGPRQR